MSLLRHNAHFALSAIFFGIAHIKIAGMFPYQWMFIIVSTNAIFLARFYNAHTIQLGLITVCFGASLWWILPDSPHTAKFLTEREKIIAVERLKTNMTGVKNAHHKQYQVVESLTDFKVWILVATIFFHNMTNSLQTNVSSLAFNSCGPVHSLVYWLVTNTASVCRPSDPRSRIQRRRVYSP